MSATPAAVRGDRSLLIHRSGEAVLFYDVKTKLVLLLRDILDRPETTIQEWRSHRYYQAIQAFYDQVLVVGAPEVFDIIKEYRFPTSVAKKVRFCGYIRKQSERERSPRTAAGVADIT